MKEKRVVFEIPGMQDAAVRRGVPYRDAPTMDLYLPAGDGRSLPW